MRLESALYTSREGLNVHGSAIAVVGDNIANTNTTGFKTQRAEFSDLVSDGTGGWQVSNALPDTGSGVEIAKVRNIFSDGTIDFTGRTLDVGITGRGLFAMGDPANPLYSRDGKFEVNEAGLLVNNQGEAVLGFAPGGTELTTLNMNGASTAGTPTSTIGLGGNLGATAEITTVPPDPATFRELNAAASSIATVEVYDGLGVSHSVSLAYFKTAPNTWTVQAYVDGGDVGGTEGAPVQIGNDLALAFDGSGVIPEANRGAAILTAAPAYSNGATAGNFNIDFGSFTQFAGQSQILSVTQDGQGTGNVVDYQINKDGQVFAQLSSGSTSLIGSVALASFVNVDGLDRVGSNMYRATAMAGDRTLGAPQSDSLGELTSGALEQSTVDLSQEFSTLILYQRGYQANSQILQAASTTIRDTLSLIR